MHVALQIKYIVIAFAALLAGLLLLGATAAGGITTMRTAAEWSAHSAQVTSALKDAQTAASDAVTVGRLAQIDENTRARIPQVREAAREKTNALVELVKDNSVQTDNARQVRALLEKRFAVQDAAIQNADVAGDTFRQNAALVLQTIESENALTQGFAQMKAEENLLLISRYDTLRRAQWRIVQMVVTLLTATFLIASGAFYITLKTLKRAQTIAKQIRKEGLERVNGGDIVELPLSRLEKWSGMIDQSLSVEAEKA